MLKISRGSPLSFLLSSTCLLLLLSQSTALLPSSPLLYQLLGEAGGLIRDMAKALAASMCSLGPGRTT